MSNVARSVTQQAAGGAAVAGPAVAAVAAAGKKDMGHPLAVSHASVSFANHINVYCQDKIPLDLAHLLK